MPTTVIPGIRIAGIASAAPSTVRSLSQDGAVFGETETARVGQSLGIRSRRVVSPRLCTSDLCFAAAGRLLDELACPRESVDALIFVSQTPDYILPATSCSLHGRLGLSRTCAAFDVNLGCSGYVYGLFLGASIIAAGGAARVLLLVGDTITRIVSPQDRSAALLFGDAGCATLLEAQPGAPPMVFELGTDGDGAGALMVPAGGFRNPRSASTSARLLRDDGNIRSDEDLYLDGGEIFTFSIGRVPQLIRSVLARAGWTVETADAFVLHQANRFMLEHIGKRLKMAPAKLVLGLGEYGNTSSASIPLAMTTELAGRLRQSSMKLVLAGFGVGLSWAGLALTCGPMILPELVQVPDEVSAV